jgi:hypothetical protein
MTVFQSEEKLVIFILRVKQNLPPCPRVMVPQLWGLAVKSGVAQLLPGFMDERHNGQLRREIFHLVRFNTQNNLSARP